MPKAKGFFAGSKILQAAPTNTLPRCGACGLHLHCTSPKMPVIGNGARKVLFVAEAPGEKEDEDGVQLVGKAGQYLQRVLSGMEFDLEEDGWKTNAVICHPRRRKPTAKEIMYCRPHLDKTIKQLQPTVIVPMGSAAVESVIGAIWQEDTGKMARWAGWQIPCQTLNAWVCPTWHPAHLLREDDPVLNRQFKTHLTAAIAHTDCPWPAGPPEWAADVRRVIDPTQAARWLCKCADMQTGAIAWDYETNMLKPDGPDARIVSCAVAWGRQEPERCIVFPWHGEAIQAMQKLLCSPIPKIASNLKFEDRWTRKEFGHRVRGWAWDTMLAAHVADNRQGITSVKFQAFTRLGVPLWNKKIEPFLKTKGDANVNAILREIDIEDLLLYNGMDALLEFRVAVNQIKEIGCPWPWKI
jgi:uracil-DNA glycosylase family 4